MRPSTRPSWYLATVGVVLFSSLVWAQTGSDGFEAFDEAPKVDAKPIPKATPTPSAQKSSGDDFDMFEAQPENPKKVQPPKVKSRSSLFASGKLAIEAGVGMPQLVGAQFSYWGLSNIFFGVALGTLPKIDSLSESIKPAPVQVGTLPFALQANPDFTLQSATLFSGFQSRQRSWFIAAQYSILQSHIDVPSDLVSYPGGQVMYPKAVAGRIDIAIHNVSAMMGYRWFFWQRRLFFVCAGGIGYSFQSSTSTQLQGDFLAVAGFIPGAQASFEEAKNGVGTLVAEKVEEYRKRYAVLPTIQVSTGFSF